MILPPHPYRNPTPNATPIVCCLCICQEVKGIRLAVINSSQPFAAGHQQRGPVDNYRCPCRSQVQATHAPIPELPFPFIHCRANTWEDLQYVPVSVISSGTDTAEKQKQRLNRHDPCPHSEQESH